MNQFLIHSLLPKSENQYLLIGDIMAGDVSVGDDILLPLDGGLMQPLKVISIEVLDQISEKMDYIGLTVASENIRLTENLAAIEGKAMQVITAPENQQQ
jgi:hypothetical protein